MSIADRSVSNPIVIKQAVPTAPRTSADPNTAACGGAGSASLTVFAASGAGATLDVVAERSTDGGATWQPVATFARLTGPGQDAQAIQTGGGTARYRWTISAGASFTFGIQEAR